VEVLLHTFLTWALNGGQWSVSRLGRFIPGERAPSTHCIGDWVGLRTGLDSVTKVKVKLSLSFFLTHHSMKAYWGSGCIGPLIL
jgi:hypothetical protein